MSHLCTPVGWKQVRLQDICDKITQGPNPKYDKFGVGKFRVLKTKDLYDDEIHYSSADTVSQSVFSAHLGAELVPGDVLLAIVGQGSINKCNVFEGHPDARFIFTRALGLIRPTKGIVEPHFLRYFLQSVAGKSMVDAGIGGTSGQQVVTTTHLKGLNIPLPPLEEQRRIVATLDEAFAAITTATANAETNLANARAVFQALSENVFGARVVGGSIDQRTVPLGEVCKLFNGRAYARNELLKEGATPVLRVGNFFTNPNWYYSDLELDDDKYAEDGDLLYAWSASFGPRIWSGGRVIYHYHIWKMLPDEAHLDKQYLFHFLEWDKERIKAAQGAGATMIHVTKASMEARLLPLPTLLEQRRIAVRLDGAAKNVGKLAALQESKISALECLRQSLLNRAFSGQLTEREPLAA